MIIKGLSHKEDKTIVNIYALNIGAPQYLRQMLTAITGEMNSNITTVGDFNTPLHQWTEYPGRKSIKKHRP